MVELFPNRLRGADPDLVQPVLANCQERFEEILLESKVVGLSQSDAGFDVEVEHEGRTSTKSYARVLVAVGRRPNTDDIGLEALGLELRSLIGVRPGSGDG